MQRVVTPGGRLGVLGSGQLGRMFALEAARLGYRVHVYSPDEDSPAEQVCARAWVGAYDDTEKIREFAESVDVVTFEFENVPAMTAEIAAGFAPVYPRPAILEIVQNRLREKSFLSQHGFPVPEFRPICSEAEAGASGDFRFPAILKTATAGYDGKGQTRVGSAGELSAAWVSLGSVDCILEECIDFAFEASAIVARGRDGGTACFPIFRNEHRHHILDTTLCPGGLDPVPESEARQIAEGIVTALDLVGLLCVELFVTKDRRILVNELAPRPHNSGHATLDCCLTSQFEQIARAITGLPLGSVACHSPAAMVNLLGDLWSTGEPDWTTVLAQPDAALHLYGKREARPGRKMGHITVLGASAETAAERARAIRASLKPL
jgi:5-(carboxyamino)imidazole ribonucleotide synthase